MEWAGAFGDLGTLIPFVVAYIAVVRMDPFGILFSFGIAFLDHFRVALATRLLSPSSR